MIHLAPTSDHSLSNHPMHSYLTAHCALARDRSRIVRSPFTGRFPFLASPLRTRLAHASGRIEFIIVLFMDWSFASGCSPPRSLDDAVAFRYGQTSASVR